MTKKILLLLLLCLPFSSCSDETYNKDNFVFCNFNVLEYPELFNVMGSPGQFATIRKHVVSGVTKITIANNASSNDYTADRLTNDFGFGKGGLIVGMNNYNEYMCYDLACPICAQAARRLTLANDGYARCANCGTTFDLNNYGAIFTLNEESRPANPRGLYRYHIVFNGTILNAYN